MTPSTRKLLTIVAEAAIEKDLVEDIERLGAHGYTISEVRGKGQRGVRDACWGPSSNIEIQIVCTAEVATAIMDHLVAHYYANYAMIAFASDVEVIRGEKF